MDLGNPMSTKIDLPDPVSQGVAPRGIPQKALLRRKTVIARFPKVLPSINYDTHAIVRKVQDYGKISFLASTVIPNA